MCLNLDFFIRLLSFKHIHHDHIHVVSDKAGDPASSNELFKRLHADCRDCNPLVQDQGPVLQEIPPRIWRDFLKNVRET